MAGKRKSSWHLAQAGWVERRSQELGWGTRGQRGRVQGQRGARAQGASERPELSSLLTDVHS